MKILIALLMVIAASVAHAASVLVAFDDNVNVGVTYKVYWGTNSGAYPNSLGTGTNKFATITNLNSGARYYFAATAVGQTNESAFSNEIQHVTPLTPPVMRSVTNTTQAAVSPGGPWSSLAIHVVDIPDGYNFVRSELSARKLQ